MHSVNPRLVSAISAASTAGPAGALATSTSITSTSSPRSLISFVNFGMSACRSSMSAHRFSTIWNLTVPLQLSITPTLVFGLNCEVFLQTHVQLFDEDPYVDQRISSQVVSINQSGL